MNVGRNLACKRRFRSALYVTSFGGAVSSVVEHYLDTVGVRGSKPLPRTIARNSIGHFMRRLFFQCLFWILATSCLEAQNNPSQTDGTRIVFTSISGPVRNAVFYAPN